MHPSSSLPEWPDLPQDVLREISARLHDPANYVHFHAVCKPWRDTASSAGMRMTKQSSPFLPWLLAPKMTLSNFLELRCVFSKTSYRALTDFSIRRRNWVTSADGTAVSYFAAGASPSLRDPLTGAITLLLPPFPRENGRWWKDSPNGIVYSDGTVLLYTVSSNRNMAKFRAAILRPGDTAWTVVERAFGSPHLYEFNIVYHRGKIMIPVHKPVVTLPNVEVGDDVDVVTVPRPCMPGELNYNFYVHNYVLESRGELLCVSIHVRQDHPDAFGGKGIVPGLLRTLSVYVHKLEEDALGPGKSLWVSKDRRCLADRVFFLGWPNSFAVDASRLNGDVLVGGCAYFVYYNPDAMPNQPGYVFRYSLINNKAKFVEQLPEEWDVVDMCTWLFPQPSIAPVQEIDERLEGRQWWKKKKRHMAPTPRSNIYTERPQPKCYNPYFRVSVGNLPRRVESFQLKQFFRKYGKVSNAKVMCKRENKMSKRFGLVTIAMVEERADALAALDGLVLNGCILEVRLVRRWKERRLPPTVNQQSTDNLTYIDLLLFLFVVAVLWKLAYFIW